MRVKDDEKLESIYNAVIRVISQEGLAQTSLSKISTESGVPKASLYTYFDTKEDMINQIYLMAKRKSAAIIFDGYDDTMGVKDAVDFLMKKIFSFYRNNPQISSFFEQCFHDAILTPETMGEGVAYYKVFKDVYERGIKEHILKPVDKGMFLVYVYNVCISLIKQEQNKQIVLNKKNIDNSIAMTWKAISVE